MKWEYYMESFTGTIDGGKMNQLGVSRWELTAVTGAVSACGSKQQSDFLPPIRTSSRTDWQHAAETLGQHFRRRRSGSLRSPAQARLHRERGFLLRVQRIRARWCCEGMAPGFTPGAKLIAQHADAPMAQPHAHSKGASRGHRASGNRNLAVCDALRGRIYSAVNDPRPGCGQIPCLWSSQTCQPWIAHCFHGEPV